MIIDIVIQHTLSLVTSRSHDNSYNETVSRQNPWVGNIAKSMMPEGNSALLPVNVDQWPSLQQGLMNFQLQNFQLHTCNKSLMIYWFTLIFVSLAQISMFPLGGEPVIRCLLLWANWCFLLGVKNHLNCTPVHYKHYYIVSITLIVGDTESTRILKKTQMTLLSLQKP